MGGAANSVNKAAIGHYFANMANAAANAAAIAAANAATIAAANAATANAATTNNSLVATLQAQVKALTNSAITIVPQPEHLWLEHMRMQHVSVDQGRSTRKQRRWRSLM